MHRIPRCRIPHNSPVNGASRCCGVFWLIASTGPRFLATSAPTIPQRVFRGFSERAGHKNGNSGQALEDFAFDQTYPLPSLPKKTSQLVTPSIFEAGVIPLYKRGWSFQPIFLPEFHAVSALKKRFAFASDGEVFGFISELQSAIEKEKHHPTIEFCYDKLSVTLFSHTAWYMTPGSSGKPSTKAYTQGVSLRDVRLAYLIEERFLQYLFRSGFEFTPFNVPSSERPTSLSSLHDHYQYIASE